MNSRIRRARISSGGVRSKSSCFGTARDDRFGTRDLYYGVVACAMRRAGKYFGGRKLPACSRRPPSHDTLLQNEKGSDARLSFSARPREYTLAASAPPAKIRT